MTDYVKIILHAGKDNSLKRFHPWVFSGAIKLIEGKVGEGDVVEVYSSKQEYLCTGHYQKGSIAVRIFTFQQQEINKKFWVNKLKAAYNYRQSIGLVDSDATDMYRLVFAEGDGFPGLIIDFYRDTAIIQSHSIGMHLLKGILVEALLEIYGRSLKAVYDKSSETIPNREKLELSDHYLYGESSESSIASEYGHDFYIDWLAGQKTGFFIDQRENRKLLATYAKNRTVLNTFCYTGAFSVYALKAGADLVDSVDSSKRAIELTEKNIHINGLGSSNHQSHTMDVFDFLKQAYAKYDLIVLDPPAFAKHMNARHQAIMGYKRLNAEALRAIKSGGILFTFSCSQVIDRDLFNHTITSAAILAGRQVRILHQLSQPADHPISIFHPEGEYLKGLVLQVE